MSDLATYVFTATYGGLELTFPVTDEHLKWSSAAADQFVYEWLAASPELWMLSMQPMLNLIKESLNVVFSGGAVADTTVLKENLTDKENMPYFWLLLGHQETLWPLTAALGVDRAAKLPFGSAYFFEFMSFEE